MFNARQIETSAGTLTNTISVSSDTSWVCSVEGNFMLDTYEGSGDTTLTISAINDTDHVGHGVIIFRYTEDDCLLQFECPFWYVDRKWLKISPDTAYFTRGLKNEYKIFNVESGNENWHVESDSDFKVVKVPNNRFYLIKENATNGTVDFEAFIDEDETTIYVNFSE